MITASMTQRADESAGRDAAPQQAPSDLLVEPDEGPSRRGILVAVGVIALLLLVLTGVDWGRRADHVVLRSSDTEDFAITLFDLPDFPLRATSRFVRHERTWARVYTSFDADVGAPGAEQYPSVIMQSLRYTNDASEAKAGLESERSSNKTAIDRMFAGSPERVDLPIPSRARESRVTRAASGDLVAYDVDHQLNNIAINTVLVGKPDVLTEARALELARISLKKYEEKVRRRTTFTQFPSDDLSFATIVHPLLSMAVPLIGYVLFILFFPSGGRRHQLLIGPHVFSIGLGALYAFLLWKAIEISGSVDTILFDVGGWSGTLTICLTIVLAGMGARLLWQQRLPPPPPRRVAGRLQLGQASCPRCRQLSPASTTRCPHCGLAFR